MFIYFYSNGRKVYINPSQIVSVEETTTDMNKYVHIHCVNHSYRLTEDLSTVLDKLGVR